jgi:hypothetical protein
LKIIIEFENNGSTRKEFESKVGKKNLLHKVYRYMSEMKQSQDKNAGICACKQVLVQG